MCGSHGTYFWISLQCTFESKTHRSKISPYLEKTDIMLSERGCPSAEIARPGKSTAMEMQVGGRGALGRGSVETLSIEQGVSAGGVGAFWN